MSRRLPVYLVLDNSGSMAGDPIQAVNQGNKALVDDLQTEPFALETAYLSIIEFNSEAKQSVPLTEIGSFQAPTLTSQGTTSLGKALRLLIQRMDQEVKKASAEEKGDWKPLVFLMTDGQPTDDWQQAAEELKKQKTANIIACAAGANADESVLKQITNDVVKLSSLKPDDFKAYFKWVTQSIVQMAKSCSNSAANGGNSPAPVDLPPPPPVIQIVP